MKKLFYLLLGALLYIGTPAFAQADAPAYVPIGNPAPTFTINTLDGKAITLEQYKGKYVLLDFWASWCPDCRKEIPGMIELYKEYQPKGMEILGISFDTDVEKMKATIDKYQIPWTQVTELKKWKETVINEAYQLKWIPAFYLIDPQGKVAFYSVTADELKAALPSIIK